MAEIKDEAGTPYRAFVCHTINPWAYPAKDRSGRLDQIEEPHLGRLMAEDPRSPEAGNREDGVWPPRLFGHRHPRPILQRLKRSARTMSASWFDYNDAKQNANLIPKGTLAKVRLTIRPGGYDDPAQGWTGGYATRGSTGAVYLSGEFTVLEGPYARRKIFSLIGLMSPKGPDWANMGRSLIRGMLNSARGISDKDSSPQAQAARRIAGFADLDGLEFVARIDIGSDTNGEDKNEIRAAVTPDHRDYAALMGTAPHAPAPGAAHAAHGLRRPCRAGGPAAERAAVLGAVRAGP